MPRKSFSASVNDWARKASGRMEMVFKESVQRTLSDAQTPVAQGGRMPVDTSFLRNSLAASLDGMPSGPSRPGEGSGDPAEVGLVIARARLGGTIWAGWTAAYARRIEYGFTGPDALGRVYNQSGVGFLETAAQKWPSTVNAVVAEARRRIP